MEIETFFDFSDLPQLPLRSPDNLYCIGRGLFDNSNNHNHNNHIPPLDINKDFSMSSARRKSDASAEPPSHAAPRTKKQRYGYLIIVAYIVSSGQLTSRQCRTSSILPAIEYNALRLSYFEFDFRFSCPYSRL